MLAALDGQTDLWDSLHLHTVLENTETWLRVLALGTWCVDCPGGGDVVTVSGNGAVAESYFSVSSEDEKSLFTQDQTRTKQTDETITPMSVLSASLQRRQMSVCVHTETQTQTWVCSSVESFDWSGQRPGFSASPPLLLVFVFFLQQVNICGLLPCPPWPLTSPGPLPILLSIP